MLPLNLDITNKRILIVGAGNVGYRKAKRLIEHGAKVEVVSIDVNQKFEGLSEEVIITQAAYEMRHLKQMDIVIAATNDKMVNRKILSDCRKKKIQCLNVSASSTSDFYIPAVLKRGDLVITVSTNGKSPSLARKIRKDLERYFDSEYGELLDELGLIRELVLMKCEDQDLRKHILNDIVDMDLESLKKRRVAYENQDRIEG